MSAPPPTKKRRLLDDEEDYIPSDQDDEVSSDDQDDYQPRVDSHSNIHSGRKRKRRAAPPSSSVEDEDSDVPESSQPADKGQKLQLSNADKRIVAGIFSKLKSWTATQLKAFLNDIKSLRSIDGVAVFEGISAKGKKDEILSRIQRIVLMIYVGEIIVEDKSFRWYSKMYRDNIDFVSFKSRIESAMRMIDSQSSKRSKAGKNAVMSASLRARLSACDKHQIILALDAMFQQQPDGKAQAVAFEKLLPKPNLENTFKRHKALMAAIRKAQPRTRYGSSRDHYCFKRCRSAINAAKKAIIADGKALMNGKDWDSCLEYLVVEMERAHEFPIWDDVSNNSAVRDLKKTFKGWHAKVKKGLGARATSIQQKQMHNIAVCVNKD